MSTTDTDAPNEADDSTWLSRWIKEKKEAVSDAFDEYTQDMDLDGDGLPGWIERETGSDPFDPDTDGDGLTDGWEAVYRTDPNSVDTDDDGLDDNFETGDTVSWTDPLTVDGDGDGLTDLDEANLGTDASEADTDEDGISDPDEVAAGTDPLVADMPKPKAARRKKTTTEKPDSETVGTEKVDSETVEDDGPITTDEPAQPAASGAQSTSDDSDDSDDSVELANEVEVDTNDPLPREEPARVDSDGDGLSDSFETEVGFDPERPDSDNDGIDDAGDFQLSRIRDDAKQQLDSDGDGLFDEAERIQGTDIMNSDTDGDGIADSLEVLLGSDPLVRNVGAEPTPVGGTEVGDEDVHRGFEAIRTIVSERRAEIDRNEQALDDMIEEAPTVGEPDVVQPVPITHKPAPVQQPSVADEVEGIDSSVDDLLIPDAGLPTSLSDAPELLNPFEDEVDPSLGLDDAELLNPFEDEVDPSLGLDDVGLLDPFADQHDVGLGTIDPFEDMDPIDEPIGSLELTLE